MPEPKPGKAEKKALARVDEARLDVTARLDDLRTAIGREVRWMPKGRGWLLPLLGFACGVALARGRKSRRRAEPGDDV